MAGTDAAEALPFIDEHSLEIDAPPERVWKALMPVVAGSVNGRAKELFAGLVGVRDRRASGRLEEAGSTIVGFRVADVQAASLLALAGRHRFSDYELIFHIDDLGNGRSRLRAETRAAFPGLRGEVYRTIVIRTRAHVLMVKRMLGAVARRSRPA
jgi:hypothetical protein